MKTKTINIYTIDELTEDAQQKAHENYLNAGFEYFWAGEMVATLKAFESIFPIEIKDYSFGSDSVDIRFELQDEYDVIQDHRFNLSGIRLAKYIWNNYKDYLYKGKFYSKDKYVDGKYTYKHRHSKIILANDCVLTGVCFDYFILQPIYDFLNKPNENITFRDLLKECIHSFESDCQSDLENQESLESFIDHAQANEYEFTADGKRY